MLEMRPNCERCDCDLPPDVVGAMICSFECTFCNACARQPLAGICPNCQGVLTARPVRARALLEHFPARADRVVNPHS